MKNTKNSNKKQGNSNSSSSFDPKALRLPQDFSVADLAVSPIIPDSKPTWWAGVASGGFQQPLKLSPGVTVWRLEDIRALIAQPRGI